MPPIRIAVYLAGLAYGPDRFGLMLDHARLADELGFHAITTSSHVVMGVDDGPMTHARYRTFSDLRRLRDTYPPDHPMLHPPRNIPCLESLSTMAALAAVTSDIELITSLTPAPLYPAPLLAKTAATVDRLSGGRLRLGVTASWDEGEYRALGVDFARRGQLLDDTVAACRALWAHGGDEPVSFDSPTVSFADVFCEPKPVSPDGVPIYYGGPFTKRTIRRLSTVGSGWFPWLVPTDRFPDCVATISEATRAAGRDPRDLDFGLNLPAIAADGKPARMWTRADLERSVERAPDLIAAGATLIVVAPHTFYDEPEEGDTTLRRVAALLTEQGLLEAQGAAHGDSNEGHRRRPGHSDDSRTRGPGGYAAAAARGQR